MKSFKQMRLDGELVRADAEKIEYANIHVEPGFNPGDRNEEDEADDEELLAWYVRSLPVVEVGVLSRAYARAQVMMAH